MILDKLKNINFDINALKNLSSDDLRDFLNENQVLVLNVAVAAGALIIAFFLGNIRLQEYGSLNGRMKDLLAKEEPVQAYKKTLQKTKDAMQAVDPGLTEEEMIPFLAEVVSRYGSEIQDLTPPSKTMESFFSEAKLSFSCVFKDFYTAMEFINDLERAPTFIKINTFSIVPDKNAKGKAGIREAAGVTVKMEISSVKLMGNDEKKPKKE